MEKKKTVFNWSGGKDSALALYKIMNDEQFEVVSLLTTINRESQRSTMHRIPTVLLQKQADSIGLPIYIVDLTPNGDMADYELAMRIAVNHFKKLGVSHFAFGDIFLHDVRSYREKQLAPYGITVVEPLWDRNSEQIMEEFLDSGLKTVVVTITDGILSEDILGTTIDREWTKNLPLNIDICGENGEYHTFCYGGGMFSSDVKFSLGEKTRQTYPIKSDTGEINEYSYWFIALSEC